MPPLNLQPRCGACCAMLWLASVGTGLAVAVELGNHAYIAQVVHQSFCREPSRWRKLEQLLQGARQGSEPAPENVGSQVSPISTPCDHQWRPSLPRCRRRRRPPPRPQADAPLTAGPHAFQMALCGLCEVLFDVDAGNQVRCCGCTSRQGERKHALHHASCIVPCGAAALGAAQWVQLAARSPCRRPRRWSTAGLPPPSRRRSWETSPSQPSR